MRVLIVDDNSENRDILRHIIEKEDNDVIETEDGQEGLNNAASHKPDLIITVIGIKSLPNHLESWPTLQNQKTQINCGQRLRMYSKPLRPKKKRLKEICLWKMKNFSRAIVIL